MTSRRPASSRTLMPWKMSSASEPSISRTVPTRTPSAVVTGVSYTTARHAIELVSGTMLSSQNDRLADVDHAEAVALWIREDDVVGVRRSLVPVNLGGAQRDKALDLGGLVLSVQVEMDTRRDPQLRVMHVEREVRADAV